VPGSLVGGPVPFFVVEASMEERSVLLELFILFAAAKVFGELFEHVHQPAVVGELLAGVLVGPHVLGLVGGGEEAVLEVVAELGVIILLFTVGLETSLDDLRQVGGPAIRVGTLGVLLPLGAGIGLLFALGFEQVDALFVSAAIVATSVGVTSRVLRDLGALRTTAARVVLGAAVVDDILAILVLAVVSGLAAGDLSTIELVILAVEVLVFLGVVLFWGPPAIRRLSAIVRIPGIPESPFLVAVLLTLGLAALSEVIGLAAIIGAFLAGLIFDFRREEVATQIEPVYELLVPFFFAITGSRLDPAVFADPSILGLAAVITVIAVVTKVAGGYWGGAGLERSTRLLVGVGMVPRGEVGLIVASLGLGLGLDAELFGVVVAMTVVTTVVTPPVLGPLVRRQRGSRSDREPEEG
jgi:Kef-type K+ transport system membrane component KefB